MHGEKFREEGQKDFQNCEEEGQLVQWLGDGRSVQTAVPQTRVMREQLDKENSQCNQSREKENERPIYREEVGTKACVVSKIVKKQA